MAKGRAARRGEQRNVRVAARSQRRSAKQRREAEKEKQRRRGRGFTVEQAGLIEQVMDAVGQLAPDLRKWLALNIPIVIVAVLELWGGGRSGNGWLTLCALARALPLDESEKAREKRLYRLLANKHLDGTKMTPLLVCLALGLKPPPWIPIVVDQTTIQGVEVILAGVRLAGRTLPVAFASFRHSRIRKSQNAVESALLRLIAASLPAGCKPIYVLDRGYARVDLLKQLRDLRIPYLVRGRRNTTVRVAGMRPMGLGRLPHRAGHPQRYVNALYHANVKEPVDVVVYHDPEFKEPWFLLVPPNSEDLLPTQQMVDLYRERMFVELTFRDWKTHLGVRGLRLETEDRAERLNRLLLAVTAAYIVAVLLGACPAGLRVRADCEVLRSRPRHGTRRRLSALTVGILMMSLDRFASLARKTLDAILTALRRGAGALAIADAAARPGWLP
jgi:hypothetical protein